MIHQQYAHERILYERYLKNYREGHRAVQQLMFPRNRELQHYRRPNSLHHSWVICNIQASTSKILEKGSFIVNGVPADFDNHSIQDVLGTPS